MVLRFYYIYFSYFFIYWFFNLLIVNICGLVIFSNGVLNGLSNIFVHVCEHLAIDQSEAIIVKDNVIHFKTFPSGSVVALK